MTGKVPPDELETHVFTRTGATDPAVTIGPQYGEDAAAISLGDQYLVISSDPVSLAAERIGTIGVHVACNDIAASGADPHWLTTTIFLPRETNQLLETITRQIDTAAKSIDVTIVGGHSEYITALTRPMLSLTSVGLTDTVLSTAGATAGDHVLLTKGAGIEGTAILATDFRSDLQQTLSPQTIDEAVAFFDEISVLHDSQIAREYATAMHDPTEGGIIAGLVELAMAAGLELTIHQDTVPIRKTTKQVCDALGIDPLRIFGSGGLLFTVPPDTVDSVLTAFDDAGIHVVDIGQATATDDPGLVIGNTKYREPIQDDLYALWD